MSPPKVLRDFPLNFHGKPLILQLEKTKVAPVLSFHFLSFLCVCFIFVVVGGGGWVFFILRVRCGLGSLGNDTIYRLLLQG